MLLWGADLYPLLFLFLARIDHSPVGFKYPAGGDLAYCYENVEL